MRTAKYTTAIAWKARSVAEGCPNGGAGRGPTDRLPQIVTVSTDWPGFPDDYGAAVDGGGSPSTAPTGNSAIQIGSPSGVNCPVRMRAMG